MLQALAIHLAFVGDLHPVIVHFPIALLPTVLLLKLYNWRGQKPWIDSAINTLLVLALAFTLLAIALGLTTRRVNGFSGEAVDAHLWLGLGTLLALALTTLLHLRAEAVARWLAGRSATTKLLEIALMLMLRGAWLVLKWLLLILLLPLVLVFLALRALYRKLLRARLQPLLRRLSTTLSLRGARSAPWQSPWAIGKARFVALMSRISTAAVWKNASYALALVLVLLTALKGADLSHGEGHLTRNMPPALAQLLGAGGEREVNQQLDQAYYEKELLPVFRRSCIKCHGEDKQKAGLRLDSYVALIGSNVVRWRDPYGSELVKRILLPRDHRAAMPPADKSRELNLDDIGRIVAWLQGHSLESVAQQGGGLAQDLKRIARALPPVDDDTLQAMNRIEGMHVHRLVQNYDLLAANLSFVSREETAQAWQQIAPFAEHMVDLDVSGTALNPPQWQQIAAMKNLRRLNLKDSPVADTDLARLADLRQLEWLNLFGSQVTLDAEALRRLLPGVKTVYLPAKAQLAAGG